MREKGREGEGETTLLGLRVRTRILTLGFKRIDGALRKQQAINPNRFISIYSTCLLYIYGIYMSFGLAAICVILSITGCKHKFAFPSTWKF